MLALLRDRDLGRGARVCDPDLGEIHFTHKGQNQEFARKKAMSKSPVHGALEEMDGKRNRSSHCSAGLGRAQTRPSAGLRVTCDPRRSDLGNLNIRLNSLVESQVNQCNSSALIQVQVGSQDSKSELREGARATSEFILCQTASGTTPESQNGLGSKSHTISGP